MLLAALPARGRSLIGALVRRGFLLAGLLLLCAAAPPAASAAGRAELDRVAAAHYDADTIRRGRDYHRTRYILFFVQTAVTLALVWAAAFGPLGRWGRAFLETGGGRPWLGRLLALTALYLGLAALRFPFSVVRYLHARDHGLRHDPWSAWLLDWAKGLGIGWLITVGVGLLVLTLFALWPKRWWIAAAAAVSVLAVGYAALAPLVIDPLFNRFERLGDRPLETRLLTLAREGGVNADEVLVADASRRTSAANAYFTGVGSTRRIVLYDTLVEKFTPDETALIVAHEVGHWKYHHVAKGMVLGLAAMTAGLWIAHRVLGRWAAEGWHGLSGRGDPALVFPAYALYLTLMLAALVPSNWVSRRMETQADRVSLELTDDPDTFISAETRLGRENLSDVVPPAWIEATLFTHPANARRILMAEQAR